MRKDFNQPPQEQILGAMRIDDDEWLDHIHQQQLADEQERIADCLRRAYSMLAEHGAKPHEKDVDELARTIFLDETGQNTQ